MIISMNNKEIIQHIIIAIIMTLMMIFLEDYGKNAEIKDF